MMNITAHQNPSLLNLRISKIINLKLKPQRNKCQKMNKRNNINLILNNLLINLISKSMGK